MSSGRFGPVAAAASASPRTAASRGQRGPGRRAPTAESQPAHQKLPGGRSGRTRDRGGLAPADPP
eukprot:364709-Chlamydomonas_euryale.AAC.18